MKLFKIALGLLFAITASNLMAQQTVGLFQYSPDASEGYTLFAPLANKNTYLIDNCGREVHQWNSNFSPGNAVYLLENGQLLMTQRIGNPTFNVGGFGGRLALLDWNSNEDWFFEYSNGDHCQHHDVAALPNGNILMIAWERIAEIDAIAQGRNPALLSGDLWPDAIYELKPGTPGNADIVWEWHAWDHLVQDQDNGKPNFGIVADHPELINLNFAQPGLGGYKDWLHSNGISYNAALDQIVLSVHNFNEVWIIDHSTTTAEAASHSGGNSGKGGDLLYRWGNPRAYDRGNSADQQLFGQHDAQWVPNGDQYEGQLMVFNNGLQRPAGNFSSLEIFAPPIDSNGQYLLSTSQAYGPALPSWHWQAASPTSFFSSGISGLQRLPGHHTLVCEGINGRFFELDSAENVIWEYINPVNVSGPLNQGDPATGLSVFKILRYPLSYPGFNGQNLVPGNPIELNPLPLPAACNSTASTDLQGGTKPAIVFPNPFEDHITVQFEGKLPRSYQVFDLQGRLLQTGVLHQHQAQIDLDHLAKGLFLLKLEGENMLWITKQGINR